MTDVAIYQPGELATAPPPTGPLDGWIAVADQVVRLAETICTSPFVPDGLRGSVPATAAAILAGRELGIPPMTALANVHVIKGKTGISALLMRALIQAQGHEWQDGHVSDTSATVRGRRKGEAEWTEVTFTAAQAKLAGLAFNGYPQDKLYARATSRLARRKFADVIAGMPYAAEELEDGDAPDTASEQAAAPAAPPRIAQRRGRAPQNVPPADALPPVAHAVPATPPPAATAGGTPLPPLPGEDESPAETASNEGAKQEPARASTGQVGIIRTHFTRLGFGDDEREQRLAATAIIAGTGAITSTKDLDEVQARAVMDTLSRCKDRDALIVLLAAGDKPVSDG